MICRKIILNDLLLGIICMFFVSCKKELGKYVYFDGQDILHLDNKCSNISEIKKARPISVYPLKNMDFYDFKSCSSCVSEELYEELVQHIKENLEKKSYPYRLELYDNISNEYDVPSFDEFCEDIKDKEKRRLLFDEIKGSYGVYNYEEFSQKLGFVDDEEK